MHCSAKSLVLAGLGILLACGRQPGSSSSIVGRGGSVPTDGALGTATVPPSNRVAINLGETPWRYLKDRDPADAMNPDYDDTAANTREAWSSVGVPQSPSDDDTFLNLPSGGGQGQLTGNILWYRKHFTLDASYRDRKIFVEFEGAHMGAQVFVNGTFLPGNSLINPQATHVVGFVPFIVDLTPYVKCDGSDNVLAVKVARGDKFFDSPNFSGAFRFGQAGSGLFRPVWMYVKDRVYIPQNTWAVLNTWGTYVSTLSASDDAAVVRVQTNVRNEYAGDRSVTLSTQIVDASGNVVAVAQETKSLAPQPLPRTPAKLAADAAPPPATFDQTLTVDKPTLWYPNDSVHGRPYLYTVIHTVSVDGAVVDATQTPLGVRTIAWDQNFPIINGHPHYLWGASGRYDYPALGSAVPEEQQWRDLGLLAAAGGSLYRPGHSSQGPEFLAAADAYGVMVVQPSGDGENGFATLCPGTDRNGCNASTNDVELKKETHRDMIVHDRNHPSVLAWEADNGSTDTAFARSLQALSRIWDPVLTRAQADRTPDPANGDLLGCSGDGCDIGVKRTYPNSPAWGSEYWGDGVGRALYDHELAFAAPYLKNWSASVRGKSFGIAHWYLADTPGEINTQTDGTAPELVRGNGASMMDANRIPRLLYYAYQSVWTPYAIRPVVKLAHHWNRAGDVTVNAFSNCPAVRLLLDGQPQGADQIPNPPTSDPSADLNQTTTLLPGQAHWKVAWAAGTLTALCLDGSGQAVVDGQGHAVADQLVTAGAADHLQLTVEPPLARPDGTSFQITANGTDAAFVQAAVVDADGHLVPDAAPVITFAVSGPGTYRGGADHGVTPGQPQGYHAPRDPSLSAEGGLAKIAVRTQFTPGTVTVTATAPGLRAGSATFEVRPTSGPGMQGASLAIPARAADALAIVASPVSQTATAGYGATFSVLTAGAGPLSFQWTRNGVAIPGATGSSYTTGPTTPADDGSTYGVTVSNGAASVTSKAATLTVVAASAPAIVNPPLAQTAVAGQQARFRVVASGSPLLSYQWQRNGRDIAGATAPVYNTPALANGDDGSTFRVIVANSAGRATSVDVRLTVAAATVPSIVAPPRSLSVAAGQTVALTVVATGSAPMHYQWALDGTPIGGDTDSYLIGSAQDGDAGTYTVTVSNAAGSVTSGPAVLTVSGSNGPNLALGKACSASTEQDAGLAARFACDGDRTTRWSSKAGVDPSWLTVDLGSPQTFDRVVLRWENAYGSAYQLQISSDGAGWAPVFTQAAGHGGAETLDFASATARYLRLVGTQRATAYGYSLYDLEVYAVPRCGGATERYTTRAAAPGTYPSTIPGLPSGPFVPTVVDNVTRLTWQQYVTTFPQQGAQFTQPIAEQYCASLGMRLPSQAEALAIAGSNYASCAFPFPWTTWTTTPVPGEDGRAYFVSSAGVSSSQIAVNAPGWALCVSGP
ncbi:discoidin domain-containing protein [Anaeromyxobacter diazotrophicus]|nr:discoidin domain-containing protein [Anaeromyxobacter diazotrophicus]